MRILIVGASGFLGRNLVSSLPSTWTIFATYNRDETFANFVRAHELTNVEPVHCDLTNKDEAQSKIRTLGDVDACVYLAANTNVSSLVADSAKDVAENIIPVVNFLGAFKGSRLIYMSSGAVYMGLEGLVSPDAKLSPTIPYSISKLTSEHYVRFYASARRTFGQCGIVRFFGAYGYHEAPRKITRRFLEQALKTNNDRVSMTIYGDGQNLIDIMWIEDAIDGIKALITSPDLNATVDFCAGNACTINEYVARLGKIVGKEIVVKHEGASHEYIRFYASSKEMSSLVGFKVRTSLQEGISRYTRWLERQQKASA